MTISEKERLMSLYLNNPGHHMEKSWWHNLKLEPLEKIFFSSCRLQKSINVTIKKYLGTDKYALEKEFKNECFENNLLMPADQLSFLIMTLGLVRINKIELLTHKVYVNSIKRILSKQQISQCSNFLLSLNTEKYDDIIINVLPISENHLTELASLLGYMSLYKKGTFFWDILQILFPHNFQFYLEIMEDKKVEKCQNIFNNLVKLLI